MGEKERKERGGERRKRNRGRKKGKKEGEKEGKERVEKGRWNLKFYPTKGIESLSQTQTQGVKLWYFKLWLFDLKKS